MTLLRRSPFILVALVAAGLAGGCGGGSAGSPTAASSVGDVTLVGTVLGSGATTSSLRSTSAVAGAGVLTVTVQENPAISTVVGADGRFTLRGLPAGGFTLVFSLDGTVIATLAFSDVRPNQEITITVALSGTTLTLVEQKRNGIGHGDVEIEGLVEEVLTLDPAGESRFVIDGHTVAARPGETTIREGGTARSVNDVTVGRRAHVKGVWLPPEAKGGQAVLAWEIKLQGPASGPGNPPPSTPKCQMGSNAQVEGLIQSKGSSSIVVRQQGKGDYDCAVSDTTRIRKGNTNFTFAQLQVGWRVHVSGTGLGSARSLCLIQAEEIKVQQQ